MPEYHLRRAEKSLTNEDTIWAILAQQKYLTLAMCKNNKPYLATLNYGFDREARCLYFHCAPEGRKITYLQANPIVWGQVLEDDGYVDGACNHAYRTVEFEGQVSSFRTQARNCTRLSS